MILPTTNATHCFSRADGARIFHIVHVLMAAYQANFSLGSEENEKKRNERAPAVGKPTAGKI